MCVCYDILLCVYARIIIETSEDDEVDSNSSQSSSGDSPADADAELAAYRNCLLRDL